MQESSFIFDYMLSKYIAVNDAVPNAPMKYAIHGSLISQISPVHIDQVPRWSNSKPCI